MGIHGIQGGGFYPKGTAGRVAALLGGLGLFLLLGPFSIVIVLVAVFAMPFWGPTAPAVEPALAGPIQDPEEFLPWFKRDYWTGRRWLPTGEARGEAMGALLCGALSLVLGPFVAIAALFMVPQLAKLAEHDAEPFAEDGGCP